MNGQKTYTDVAGNHRYSYDNKLVPKAKKFKKFKAKVKEE
jgi:hypothetical protein